MMCMRSRVLSAENNNAEADAGTSSDIDTSLHSDATWGPWLFRLSMAGTLLFMWWLVIYDHGVAPHH